MGLFSKKKEKEEKRNFKFDFGDDFPKYESEVGEESSRIKEAVSEISSPVMPKPSMMHSIISPSSGELNGRIKQGKTLFVKIDKYKDVIKTLEQIRSKLEDSEKILGKLTNLKEEEDRELETWHSDLAELKEKLLEIDSKLFEE